jgi:hypothetical protein
MSLLNTLLNDKTQSDALQALAEGDEVLVAYMSDIIPFHVRHKEVTRTTPKYVWVGALKFYRQGGKQVGAKKSQRTHYALYAITPAVEEALAYKENR